MTQAPSGLALTIVHAAVWVVGSLVPSDVAAGGTGRGEGKAIFDGDLVGVGADGDLGGLARVRQELDVPNAPRAPSRPRGNTAGAPNTGDTPWAGTRTAVRWPATSPS